MELSAGVVCGLAVVRSVLGVHTTFATVFRRPATVRAQSAVSAAMAGRNTKPVRPLTICSVAITFLLLYDITISFRTSSQAGEGRPIANIDNRPELLFAGRLADHSLRPSFNRPRLGFPVPCPQDYGVSEQNFGRVRMIGAKD
jgi:hypothetical protein